MIELFDLKKRFFLVTGAAGLLGSQHCEAILAANGIPVAIDLDNRGLQRLKSDLEAKYQQRIYIFQCSITNLKELQGFLGTCNYVRPHAGLKYSRIMAPLRPLLKADGV